MEQKNGLLAFALVGLAAGAVTYYLLGTDQGRKKLKGTNGQIKELTRTIEGLTKKQKKKAEKVARNAQHELEDFGKKAKETGGRVLEKAADATSDIANKVENM